MKNKNNIHYAPCLRNSVACDHDFWYTCDGSCRGFYHFFKILSFLSCYLGWKGKKWPKMMKNVIWRTDLRNRTSSLSFMVHLCEMRKYPGLFFFFFFFNFFKIFIFRIFRGKREKMDQTDKKLCLSCLISQGPYIIWSSFMVHMCKMIISPGIFHFFLNKKFYRLLVG